MADLYGLEPNKFLATVKATCFRTEKAITNEQLASLLVVCERYNLDPFAKHLYAFPDRSGGIVPVVSIDGWIWLVNRQPLFDGMEFDYDEAKGAMTCTIWIKGRSHAVRVTEYVAECRRNTEIWKTMPRRMIRHRALVQCARVAFGLSGIYDEEEAEDIARGHTPRTVSPPGPSNAERFQAMAQADTVVEMEPTPEHGTEPEGPTLIGFIQQIERAVDSFAGDMIVAEAREVLDDEGYREVLAACEAKFPTNPADEGDQP
jgi:phage recombination protein Bet